MATFIAITLMRACDEGDIVSCRKEVHSASVSGDFDETGTKCKVANVSDGSSFKDRSPFRIARPLSSADTDESPSFYKVSLVKWFHFALCSNFLKAPPSTGRPES